MELVSDRIIEYARGCMYNEKRASPFQSKTRSFQLDESESDLAISSEAAAMHGHVFAGGVSLNHMFPS